MADQLTKQDVKDAVRETFDDIAIAYSHGAGAFFDSLLKAATDVVDAFDNFYTRNLAEDRPAMAQLALELRLRNTRKVLGAVESRIRSLEAQQQELEGPSRKAPGRARTPAKRRSSRK